MSQDHAKAQGADSRAESAIHPSLEAWLRAELASTLGLDEAALDPTESFHTQGLDSLQATALMSRLSTHLGRAVSPVLIWRFSSIRALAAHLAGAAPLDPTPTLDRTTPRGDEPIAIVGMACRFPGGANDPASFWKLLCEGVDAIGDIPPGRWDVEAYFNPDPTAPGKMSVKQGGFLDQVDGFDPLFFGISPREAEQMDPQQRLLLELSWEALEDAGIPPGSLRGSSTAVDVGAVWSDWALLQKDGGDAALNAYSATGSHRSIVANRISYALGLQGPSMAIDTACSSSLVAIHLACQQLRTGEATLALAGGVNLMLAPESTVALTKFGGLSPGSRCRAFAADADGFARGEGGALLVLQPLSAALAQGAQVYAVIRGSAVNNDGASNGLTAPNPAAQVAVLEEACRRAGVAPAEVDYVEAHGTGTSLGDPIEAESLGEVFGRGRSADRPLRIGSVKTNLGHLEAAAGVAGLMKVALSLRHGMLVPSLHFNRPNPHIHFDDLKLSVQTGLAPWPRQAGSLAGVSAFGFGGTNCHVLIEQVADERATIHACEAKGNARRRLETSDAVGANDASRTSQRPPRIAFVFPPQGSQWLGMATQLLVSEPAFRDTLLACDEAFRPVSGWSLCEELAADPARSRMDHDDVVQPLLVSVQIALAALWRSWGVEPAMVLGHSLGEISAACCAGALTVGDAMRLLYHYSRLVVVAGRRTPGGMAVVGLSAKDFERSFGNYLDRVVVAGYNAPDSTVLSGDREALRHIVDRLKLVGVLASLIQVQSPAHSPALESVREELCESVGEIKARSVPLPIVSSLRGARTDGAALTVEYFADNLRHPMRFAQAFEELARARCEIIIEVSPHPILVGSMKRLVEHHAMTAEVLPSVRRGDDGLTGLLESATTLHGLGVDIAWNRISPTADSITRAASLVPTNLLLPLSAHSEPALRQRARDLARTLASSPALPDLAFTAALHREHLPHRLSLAAQTPDDLADKLSAFADGELLDGASSFAIKPGRRPRVAFVFSGQGSQWLGMGRELIAAEPVFRDAIERCDRAIAAQTGWSVLDELKASPERSRLEEVSVIQPMIFALQVALAELLRAQGIEPEVVVGHSMGEVAAAHIAGALSLDDAARIICARSAIAHRRASGKGGMALVELSRGEADALLVGRSEQVSVAVSNGPRSTVLSGERDALDALLDELRRRDVWVKSIKVDYASHSPQMDPLRAELFAALEGICPRDGTLPLFSTVTVKRVSGAALDAAYWVENLRRPVLFAEAIQTLAREGVEVFVEIAPHPVLVTALQQNLAHVGAKGLALGSGRREGGERLALLGTLGALWTRGASVDFQALFPHGGRRVSLPTYPWQRERYWLEKPAPRVRPHAVEPGEHPLLGHRLSSPALRDLVFEQRLRENSAPWLSSHRIGGVPLLSAGVIIATMAAALSTTLEGPIELRDLAFLRPLPLSADTERRVQSIVREPSVPPRRIELFASEGDRWTCIAAASVATAPESFTRRAIDVDEDKTTISEAAITSALAHSDSSRRWIAGARGTATHVHFTLHTPADAPALPGVSLHPSLIGEVLALFLGLASDAHTLAVPARINRLTLGGTGEPPHRAHAVIRDGQGSTAQSFIADLRFHAASGALVASFEGLHVQRLAPSALVSGLTPAGATAAPSPPRSAQSSLRARAVAAPPADRPRLVLDHVRALAARILGLRASHPLDVNQGLAEIGLGSLAAVELRARLGDDVGAQLPSTLAFDHPSVAAIADFLLGEVLDLAPTPPDPAPASPVETDELDGLSEDELSALLLDAVARVEQGGSQHPTPQCA